MADFDHHLPYHDSLNFHFWHANLWWQLNLRYTVFENSESYGFQFIRSDTLSSLLTLVYENDAKLLDDIDARLSPYHYNVVEPCILNLFRSTSFGSAMIPLDFELLRIDQKYRTILKTNIGNRKWFEGQLRGRLLERLQELDRRILKEINCR